MFFSSFLWEKVPRKIAPSPAPVVHKISGPMGGRFSYTTGAEAENSAVKFSKESVPPLLKKKKPSSTFVGGGRGGGLDGRNRAIQIENR